MVKIVADNEAIANKDESYFSNNEKKKTTSSSCPTDQKSDEKQTFEEKVNILNFFSNYNIDFLM